MSPSNTPPTDEQFAAPPRSYWQHTRRLTLWLSAIWFCATFCVIFFARDLYGFTLFGWPISFYMAAQGILLVYVAIVGGYAWTMRKLDRQEQQKQHRQRMLNTAHQEYGPHDE